MNSMRKNKRTDPMIQNLILFLNDVIAHEPERGVVKQMDCPICGGMNSVRYTRSTYNGHLHARCDACAMNVTE